MAKRQQYNFFLIRQKLPSCLMEVLKDRKKHRIPGGATIVGIFLQALADACGHEPDRIAQLMRKIYIYGLKIVETENEVTVTVNVPKVKVEKNTLEEPPQEGEEKPAGESKKQGKDIEERILEDIERTHKWVKEMWGEE